MKLKIYFIIRKLIFCLFKGHNSKTVKGIIIKINFDLYLIVIIDHIKKPMIVSTETKDIIIAHILKGHYSITVRLYDQNHDLYFVIISNNTI
jgi:hypothetical protein